jgi:hypothetical protein
MHSCTPPHDDYACICRESSWHRTPLAWTSSPYFGHASSSQTCTCTPTGRDLASGSAQSPPPTASNQLSSSLSSSCSLPLLGHSTLRIRCPSAPTLHQSAQHASASALPLMEAISELATPRLLPVAPLPLDVLATKVHRRQHQIQDPLRMRWKFHRREDDSASVSSGTPHKSLALRGFPL